MSLNIISHQMTHCNWLIHFKALKFKLIFLNNVLRFQHVLLSAIGVCEETMGKYWIQIIFSQQPQIEIAWIFFVKTAITKLVHNFAFKLPIYDSALAADFSKIVRSIIFEIYNFETCKIST